MTVISRLRSLAQSYPRQFWLLFWGMLISTLGSSMVWPFLMIYVSEQLVLPLTTVTSLMSLNAGMGLVFSFVAGPVTDRFGRKWVMVISLVVNGLCYFLMSQAQTLGEFAILMAASGAFNPLYRVGADAMMADLVPAEKRMQAYALLRTSNNAGIALGPAIGGLVATVSYTIAFYGAATGLITFSLLIALFARETLPARPASFTPASKESWAGYPRILSDRPFVGFLLSFTLTSMCASLIWVLLGVYAKQNYGVPESQYGFVATTNALMVVFLQLPVTTITRRFQSLPVLAVGALFYALGVGSVALGQGFWGFWLSMVIMTIGELVLTPTAVTYVANLAPPDMRGRYMSLYGLTWGTAAGIAPLMGGYLNDNYGPIYIWYGGFFAGMLSVLGFILLSRRNIQPVKSLS